MPTDVRFALRTLRRVFAETQSSVNNVASDHPSACRRLGDRIHNNVAKFPLSCLSYLHVNLQVECSLKPLFNQLAC
jgi:hypothetical protein